MNPTVCQKVLRIDKLYAGMRQVQAAAIKAGAIKAALLPVSGAFHTRLMEPARAAILKARR